MRTADRVEALSSETIPFASVANNLRLNYGLISEISRTCRLYVKKYWYSKIRFSFKHLSIETKKKKKYVRLDGTFPVHLLFLENVIFYGLEIWFSAQLLI